MEAPADDGPWLVVGLGNPGASYAGNRHNVGFMVVDLLAERTGARLRSHRSRAEIDQVRIAGRSVVLARPRTFMNVSGPPVAAVRAFYKIDLSRVIVVHDELDIPFDAIRLKRGGGDNGHNGLRSITSSLGSRDYLRVRVGIGRPPGRMDPADFVLRDFSPVERKALPLIVDNAADAVESLLQEELAAVQNRFHAG
ncbi:MULTISPECIES: aminoacyl-tRNA hydrolase [unclassified Parafrankia]|uniref:aminoacyl-tRNA hydrolase n=1 Tax=unclassified Parafrankia TaxID=2994368 RepID=UPI000DA53E62|nr:MULTISPECIES: aminoacyl-tRNA hydrolase [unclassified Parafrankia]TCJ36820.1 aminoacyl-tRNA hydrolase [Parafrankia sp. BMG5.11]SQD94282.1 Peptidyl-tRNA hydrolase [Parafrankia sp. Ea1.12]